MALVYVLVDGQYLHMDESQLVRTDIVVDNDHEYTTAVEYRLPGSDTIVHRSAHVTLKKVPEAISAITQFFG